MPTKRSVKKEIKIEEIIAKDLNAINTDLIKLQNNLRLSVSNIGNALLERKEELDNLIQAISIKNDELKEVENKEKLILDIQELKEQFEDTTHEYKRLTKQLEIEFEEKKSELEREYQTTLTENIRKIKDEERERRLKIEDEEIQRERNFNERELALKNKEEAIAIQTKDLGDFQNRVDSEVLKVLHTEKIKLNFEMQTIKKESEATKRILQAQIDQLNEVNADLKEKLIRAEQQAQAAADRANAIAISSLDKESGKAALEEIRAISHKQAESGKR